LQQHPGRRCVHHQYSLVLNRDPLQSATCLRGSYGPVFSGHGALILNVIAAKTPNLRFDFDERSFGWAVVALAAGQTGARMAEDVSEEISLFDIADWLWSFRWLMLVCLAIAIAGAALAWQNTKAPEPTYDVKLQIFSGGTPVRGPAEIADIVISGLEDEGLVLKSAQSANPIIFQTTDAQIAGRVEATIATLTDALIEEVRVQEVELGRLVQGNETALSQYLMAKSFIEGVRSGLIPLIETSIAPSTVSQQSRMLALLLPVLASGVLFFLVAGTVSFSREWKKRRALR
jgi:uncharacterized protein involved in exopolysaccharide biosynthesis